MKADIPESRSAALAPGNADSRLVHAERYTLYGARTGNCLRVAITFEALDIPYHAVTLDLAKGEQHSPAFLELNRTGRVPVVVRQDVDHEPHVMTQSSAIMLHLCTLRPSNLLPAAGETYRLKVLERFMYFVTDVIVPAGDAFHLARAQQHESSNLLHHRSTSMILGAEEFLGDGAFMGGDHMSIADIAAVTITKSYSDKIDWERVPKLRDWFMRMMHREDILKGLAAFSA